MSVRLTTSAGQRRRECRFSFLCDVRYEVSNSEKSVKNRQGAWKHACCLDFFGYFLYQDKTAEPS
jgi:hypothetical protein